MARNGWVPKTRKPVEKLRELCRFYAVGGPDQLTDVVAGASASFRRSTAYASRPPSIAAWLREGERRGHSIETAVYDEAVFREVLDDVRHFTAVEDPRPGEFLQRRCADAGVAIVFVRELEGAPVTHDETAREAEADRFAADFLVPPRNYTSFCERGAFDRDRVLAFAADLGIAPGIVVGRLQHDGRIARNRLNGLKRRYAWE